MLEELRKAEARFVELEAKISDSEIVARDPRYRDYIKEHGGLNRLVSRFKNFEKAQKEYREARELSRDSGDPEMAQLAEAELPELKAKLEKVSAALKLALVAKEDDGDRGVIMEIRAGTGGDESAIFVGDLQKMYQYFADRQGWNIETLYFNASEKGGFKEIVFSISGDSVYSKMKYECGTHRVQRVPETENQGRVHTSAATVAVLPEVEEVDIVIRAEDVRKDTYCSSGPGGQSVNTTYSAVRLTHVPTGLVVTCQDEKSQVKNTDKAMRVLRSRLYEMQKRQVEEKRATTRRAQIGTGDRSQRIRTYNFPQNRLTDHRIGLTLYDLAEIMRGQIDEVVDTLIDHDTRSQFSGLFDEED